MATKDRKKLQLAIMNAVHDLPVLVARDEGFFADEGLDIQFVTTPGMAQTTTSHHVEWDVIFDRPLDSVYNEGRIDQFRMCEWGIVKRAVECTNEGTARSQDRGPGSGDVFLRHRRPPGLRYVRARAAQGPAYRRDAVQRLQLHHPEDDGGLP